MNPNIAKISSLLSDPSRSSILLSLMDGRIHPAGELAYLANIKPQTASFHLNKLLEAKLISVEKHGRHRYYRLSNSEAASVIEQLLSIAPKEKVTSLKDSKEKSDLHFARTCYDHLAGYVGVQITNSLVEQGMLRKVDLNFEVTSEGSLFFSNFGINEEQQRNKRRAFARCCLDWSERQHHLAGALGNALLVRMLEEKWIVRMPKTRAIKITQSGKTAFEKYLKMYI
ncbi:winged helix-turn-helix domain-containing protein [Bacillus inaquosorum]|uniref:ArsR family transcriptional regulator n=1 Tax=Bacillus inaquosorum KCTC 13429 TaxID=1236548 RepID=A0A9W5LGP6_9BACI|nr:winged helix-turn-helix domain-containing protein [Bacillus inaquosorum]AWM15901.1 ArsR family transcriptional regulator [Bacillus inaquosorum]ELS60321.1 ArsR family transcriptional regulator [Bacillus inaquosorum KCTC 13429]MCY7749797.1 winged helix-turn-helix domain-containing protein [Bacillus inaquosorum]MCY7908850.1 winged helix-turn-helix domain-containing protein [Bacillus inaquosorum]MCY7949441.1 winged helix-turn-helix domain-containing protein [Bacillus inaquosorum]